MRRGTAWMIALFAGLAVAGLAQADKGKIARWNLVDVLHGSVPAKNPEYDIQWEVIKIDPNQGNVRAKLFAPKRPECMATAEFKWSFSRDIRVLEQDDKIPVTLWIDAKPNDTCGTPADPKLTLRILGGQGSFEAPSKRKGFFI